MLATLKHHLRGTYALRIGCFIVLGIAILTIHGLSLLFGSPAEIEISQQSTRLLNPLTPDGRYIDYATAMQRQYAAPGQIELANDPWFVLTFPGRIRSRSDLHQTPAYTDPLNEFARQSSHGEATKRLIRRMHVPFSDSDDPELTDIINGNAAWYDAIQSTNPGMPGMDFTQSHSDGTARIEGIGDALSELHLEISRRFVILSMSHLGNGRMDAGMSAARTILTVADRDQRSPSINSQRRSCGLRQAAHNVIWAALLSSRDIPESYILDTLRMPVDTQLASTIADRWDVFVRFEELDLLEEEHRTHCRDSRMIWTGELRSELKERLFWRQVDWNAAMKFCNELVDAYIKTLQIHAYRERTIAQTDVFNSRSAFYEKYGSVNVSSYRRLLTEDMTSLVIARLGYLYTCARWSSELICFDLNDRRRTHLVARFAAFRKAHGYFPETLDSLLQIPGLPDAPENVTIDAFSEKPFKYERQGNGFVLKSVGLDMEDDSQRAAGQIRSPRNDFVWQWPLKE